MQLTSHCRKCGRVMTSERIESSRVRMSCSCGFSDFRALPDMVHTANPYYREPRFIAKGELEKGKHALFMRRAGREHQEIVAIEEISRLVSSGAELTEMLQAISARLAEQIHADVCNIYLRQGEEMVLTATQGFAQEHVGAIRLKMGEGITGTVAKQMKPLNLSSAWRDPRFKVFPELNEERYNAMLSYPITDEKEIYGVINLQMTSVRRFQEDEIHFVSIVASLILSAIKLRRVPLSL